jgi:hypothetical protein
MNKTLAKLKESTLIIKEFLNYWFGKNDVITITKEEIWQLLIEVNDELIKTNKQLLKENEKLKKCQIKTEE